MRQKIFLLFILTILWSCTGIKSGLSQNEKAFIEIPQGIFTYEIYFAEWDGRMPNRTCTVEIKGNKITVSQDETTKLTGGSILFEGMVLKYKSGVWILAEKESDIYIDDVGGCTENPIIDFDKKLIVWC